MKNYHEIYLSYKNRVDKILIESVEKQLPASLYAPLRYLLHNSGKRIRPVMLIFTCESAGGTIDDALNASVAMELLHNFTLVHDDIMDNADTRRGKDTIHKKWNTNVAILSGDLLIGLAYSYLVKTKSERIDEILKFFSEGIVEVCEGQSYDKEFEERKDVTPEEYLMMIGKKTAKMLETAAAIGAIIGNADKATVEGVKSYAMNTGLAFQIQDDLLDINAEESEFGKKIGGDLVEGKKTYLLLKALETIKEKNDLNKIQRIVNDNGLKTGNLEKIIEIKNIYERNGIIESAKREIEHYTKQADKSLEKLSTESNERLKWFSEMLMGRSF